MTFSKSPNVLRSAFTSRWPGLMMALILTTGIFFGAPLHAALYDWKESIDGDFNDPNRWSGPDFKPGVPKAGDDAGMSGISSSQFHTVTISSAPELRYTYIAYNAIRLLDRFVVTGTNFVQGAPCVISGPGSMEAAFFEAISDFTVDQASVKVDTLEHRNGPITITIKNGGRLDSTQDTSFNGHTLFMIVEGAGSRWRQDAHFGWRASLTVLDGGKAMLPSFDGFLLRNESGEVSINHFSTKMEMLDGTLMSVSGDVFDGFMRGGRWIASSVITNQGGFAMENGASVVSGGGVVGRGFVRGAGTTWAINGELHVPGGLFVESGGRVSVGRDVNLGPEPDVGGSILIRGPGSRAVVSGNLNIAIRNRASSVFVREQGALEAAGGSLGSEAGAVGSLNVSGAGSRLSLGGPLSVGEGGKGELRVEQGALLELQNRGQLDLGTQPGGHGEVSVSGGGTTLDTGGAVCVGRRGRGSFNVEGGAFVTLGSLIIGESGQSNVVKVAESGSELQVTDALEIGKTGTGQLRVEQSGTVVSAQAALGVNGSTLGSATIQGRGSSWNVARDLVVGQEGQGETFVLRGGALVVQSGDLSIGNTAGAVGLLTIDGQGSKLSVPGGGVRVGVDSVGILTISRGAQAVSKSAQLGINDGQARVIVGQDDAQWIVSGALEVGVNDVASLRVDKHALLQAEQGFVGRQPGGAGFLQIGGDGARLVLNRGLTVGEEGSGILEIAAGGSAKISGGEFVVAAGADSSAQVIMGSSSGTLDAESSPTIIGEAGAGTLSVLPQGHFTSGPAQMAVETDSTGIVTVTGRQARWRVRGGIAVGGQGEATLIVAAKGTVEASGEINVGPKGRLCGDGTVKAVVVASSGELCPGASPGTLAIEGDYAQRPQGRLEIEFAGPVPGEGHDLVTVTGNATLGGTLRLKFIDAFAPKNGQAFAFLNVGTNLAGTFEKIELSGLADGFQYELASTSPGTLSLLARSDGVATSPPRLRIENTGANAVLSWRAAAGFQLESGSDLGSATGWRAVSSPPVLNLDSQTVTLPVSAAGQFFRLRKP